MCVQCTVYTLLIGGVSGLPPLDRSVYIFSVIVVRGDAHWLNASVYTFVKLLILKQRQK